MANCERSALFPLRGPAVEGRVASLSLMRRPGGEGFIRQTLVPSADGASQPSSVSLEKPIGGASSVVTSGFSGERPIAPESFAPVELFVSPSLIGESI